MIKCTKGQVRWLTTALRWKIPAEQRQRIQMVLLRESGMTQPLIAAAMGVSLSTVNRAHMAYDHGGIEALKPRPSGGRKHENMALEEEKALLARFAKARVSRARGQRKTSLNPRHNLQLQRPTPPHLSQNAPSLPGLGDADMARSRAVTKPGGHRCHPTAVFLC
jgi:Winged helix-turn helix